MPHHATTLTRLDRTAISTLARCPKGTRDVALRVVDGATKVIRMMPLFSIVVPTLQRSDTLRHTLATLIDQTFNDFEIVIQNNGGDARTESVVHELNDSRIRHFASPSVLPMVDNWEAALRNARGTFITFVGDDDGFFPDACHVAADILQRTQVEALTWHPFCYHWPNFVYPTLRDRLLAAVDYDFGVQVGSA